MTPLREVPAGQRAALLPLVDRSFSGLYRLHARRTLRSAPWVLASVEAGDAAGLIMLSLLEPGAGYVYYVAVDPPHRRKGLGLVLLDAGLEVLRDAGARETFSCVKLTNVPMVLLLRARGFREIGFRALTRARGLAGAVRLMTRMVAAPGETVFVRGREPGAEPAA